MSFDLPGLGFATSFASTSAPASQTNRNERDRQISVNAKTHGVSSSTRSDKEEGELSDVSMHDAFYDPPLIVDRKRKRGSENLRPAIKAAARRSSSTMTIEMPQPASDARIRSAISDFIRVWLSAGLGYDQLKKEVHESNLLDSIYGELNLSTITSHISTIPQVSKVGDSAEKRVTSTGDPRPMPPVLQTQLRPATSPMTVAAGKAVIAPNRSEYLARLQAARTSKSGSPITPVTAITIPTLLTTNAVPPTQNNNLLETPSFQSQPVTQKALSAQPSVKVSYRAEAIRKKLEMIQNRPEKTAKRDTDESVWHDGQDRAVSIAAHKSQGLANSTLGSTLHNAMQTPELPSSNPSGSSTPIQQQPPPTVPALPPSIISTTLLNNTPLRTISVRPTSSAAAFKREPFSLGGVSTSDETVIMDISDEDSESDSDSAAESRRRGRSAQVAPANPNLSSRPLNGHSPSASRSRSAHGMQTADLERKQREIMILNERIALYEKRKKVQASLASQRPVTTVIAAAEAAVHNLDVRSTADSDGGNTALSRVGSSLRSIKTSSVQNTESLMTALSDDAFDGETVQSKMQQLEALQRQAEQIQAELDADTPIESNFANRDMSNLSVSNVGAMDLELRGSIEDNTTSSKGHGSLTTQDMHHNDIDMTGTSDRGSHEMRPSNNVASTSHQSKIDLNGTDALQTATSENADPAQDSDVETSNTSDQSHVTTSDESESADDTDADMDISSDGSRSEQDSRVQQIENASRPKTGLEHTRSASSSSSSSESSYAPSEPENIEPVTESFSFTESSAVFADPSVDPSPPELEVAERQLTSSTEKFLQDVRTRNYFEPYNSPFKTFTQFRFHPQFQKKVAGGFKSRTYSHLIDSDNQLCRFELDGGICNDTKCSYQHFRDMDLSDDAILVQLGSPSVNPGKTDDERNEYNKGLMQLVRQFKTDNVSDIEEVASRIAQYRRDFIGDFHKVLVI